MCDAGCWAILQIVRDEIGRAIVLTNAYRNEAVNRAIGGVRNSDHMNGDASDSRAAGLSALTYARMIAANMKPGGPLHGKIDQLILESSRNVVHLSSAPRLRGHIRTQRGGPGSLVVEGLNP